MSEPLKISPNESMSPRFRTGVRAGITSGLRKGLRGYLWICRILLPVSFAVALLDWTGWLYALDPVFQPLMGIMNLPPQAALPILTAVFTSFYAGLVMIVVIPFTEAQVTLLAVFTTICHMLIVEGLIQHKAGLSFVQTTAVRLVTAGATVYVVSLFFTGTETPVAMPETLGQTVGLGDMLVAWTVSTLQLLGKILLIIIPVMVALETLKALGWSERLASAFRPFMTVLGLSPGVSGMWVAGAFFGIVYGSAVICEEAASGQCSREELKRLHISLGINHSMVEDPALFLALGISLFWTVIPRILAAAAAVHLYRIVSAAARARAERRAAPA